MVNKEKFCEKIYQTFVNQYNIQDDIICDNLELLNGCYGRYLWYAPGWIAPHDNDGEFYIHIFGFNDIPLLRIYLWNDYYTCTLGAAYDIYLPTYEQFENWKLETGKDYLDTRDMVNIIELIIEKLTSIKNQILNDYNNLEKLLYEYSDTKYCKNNIYKVDINSVYNKLINAINQILSTYKK